MLPPNLPSECRLRPWNRKLLLRSCSLSLALLCSLPELQATKRPLNSQTLEQDLTSIWEKQRNSLSEAQRVFDATVRPRLRAQLVPSTTELGERECRAADPNEQLRGRLEPAVVLAANEQLNLPMGAGSVLTVAGEPYLFCLEPHYHPPGGGISPEGWHKGVTVYHTRMPKERRL